jgi:RimJ/RimL family protein N-acetyltransferase
MFPDLMRDDVFRLETKRLWLRWPRAADAVAVAKLAGDAEVAEMTAQIPHPYPAGAAAEFILSARAGNLSGESLVLVLTGRSRPNEAIGCIGLHATDRTHATLGFWLGRPHWGQGLMTEAGRALLDMAFQVTDLHMVTATARPGNGRSIGVMEACGFEAAGTELAPAPARGGPLPMERFRLLRDDMGRRDRDGDREQGLARMQMQTA